MHNLFFLVKDVGICNFADDTTTYICDNNLENVLKSLEKNSMLVICLFEKNYMKLIIDKCHLIVSGYKHERVWANIGKDLIWESNDVKLLGITIDRNVKFGKHVLKYCGKVNHKLSALSRMAKLFSLKKGHFLKLTGISGLWTLDPGCWTLDAGRWTLNSGRWTLDRGRYT